MQQDDFTPKDKTARTDSALSEIDYAKNELDKPEQPFEDTDRLLFLRHLNHPGDTGLLSNEAFLSGNLKLVTYFTILFLTFTLLSAISCYLNYKLEQG